MKYRVVFSPSLIQKRERVGYMISIIKPSIPKIINSKAICRLLIFNFIITLFRIVNIKQKHPRRNCNEGVPEKDIDK